MQSEAMPWHAPPPVRRERCMAMRERLFDSINKGLLVMRLLRAVNYATAVRRAHTLGKFYTGIVGAGGHRQ